MKRYITIALCALTVFGLGSCNKVHEEDFDNAGRSVTFQAQLGNDTRTGLALKFVPDWRQTTLSDVHIWEVAGSERYEGEDVKMRIPGEAEGNYEIALFKADFSNMTIIVNPPSNAPTRAGETYTYTSIVAPKDASGKFTVPSTQTPNSATLIDPHADFIVGKSPAPFDQSQAGKEVNLIFTRPVAISRLSIMNVEDPTIKQVKIYSSDKLTGSASYENLDFANATVSFDNSGSNVITLDYGSGVAMPAEGIFNAYFISLVGTKRITKIEVVTNAQTLTKEFEGGKALTFKVPDFKSIAVNMGGSGTPGPNPDQPQNIQFVRGTTVVTSDSYDLYTGGTYVSPTISGAAPGATLTYETGDPSVATVSTAGVVAPVGVGETTITAYASAVTGYEPGIAQFTLTVTDSTPAPVNQPLTFTRNGEEVPSQETYDLHSGAAYVSPVLSGAVDNATVTYAISCNPEGCAIIDADGKITPVAVGVAIVTATASAVAPLYNETSKSYTLQIVDSTPVDPSQGKTYTRISGQSELVTGTYLIVSVNNQNKVLKGGTGDDADRGAVVDATVAPMSMSGNTITIAGDASVCEVYEYVITRTNNSITLKGKLGYLKHDRPSNGGNSTTYIGFEDTVSSSSTFTVNTNPGNHISGADAVFFSIRYNNSDEYLYYNTGGYYKLGGSGAPSTTKYGGVFLYKLNDGGTTPEPPTPVAQDLTFSTDNVVGVQGETVTPPTLTGNMTDVTYSSSAPSIVAVDAQSGALTLSAVGEAYITATAAAGTVDGVAYEEGTATYHVTVVPPLEPVAETTYTLVTNTLSEGTYILVSDDSSSSYNNRYTVALFPTVVTTSWGGTSPVENGQRFNEKDVTLSGNTVVTDDPEIVGAEIELVASGSGWKIKAKATGEYLVVPTENYRIPLSTNAADAAVFTISTAQNRSITATGNYYFFHSGSATGFTIRNTNSAPSNVRFYKKAKLPQTLSFSGASATYDLKDGGSWTNAVPALDETGAETTVTYASSNTAVAVVNSNSGAITIPSTAKKGDTATITATAEETDEYEEATASYTITIVDTTPGGDEPSSAYYQRVTASSEFVQDGVYVIVNEANNKLFKPVLNSTNTNFQTTNNTIDVTIADGKIASSSAVDACQIVLKNADGNGKFALFVPSVNYYLQVYNGSNFKADASDNGYRSTFSVTSAGVASIYRDNSHYIRYSGSNSAFQVGSNSNNIAVYKYVSEGGTTPEPPTPQPTSTYTQIAGDANLETGTYVIADKTNTYLLNASGTNNGGYSTINSTSGVTMSGSTITLASNVAEAHEFEITRTGDNLTVKKVGGDHEGQYLFASSSVANSYMGFQGTAATFVINKQTGTNLIYFSTTKGTSDPTEYLYKKAADQYFKLGQSGAPGGSDAGIYLYKKN